MLRQLEYNFQDAWNSETLLFIFFIKLCLTLKEHRQIGIF